MSWPGGRWQSRNMAWLANQRGLRVLTSCHFLSLSQRGMEFKVSRRVLDPFFSKSCKTIWLFFMKNETSFVLGFCINESLSFRSPTIPFVCYPLLFACCALFTWLQTSFQETCVSRPRKQVNPFPEPEPEPHIASSMLLPCLDGRLGIKVFSMVGASCFGRPL